MAATAGSATTPFTDVRPRRSRLVVIGGMVALAVAIATFAVKWTSSDQATVAAAATSPPSIAVLPLRDLGAAPGDATVADGMTEALVAVLARGGDVRVIPSSWVLALQQRRMDVRQIAETLRVAYLLEGGVQQEGRRLRMQLRLIDTHDGSTRWTETYDRRMDDVFAVQDEVAQSVTRALDVRLAAGARRGTLVRRHTPSIAAYEWYLRGIDGSLIRSDAGQQRAIEYLQRAIAADSSFADAYAGLARVYMNGSGAPGTQRDAFARAAWAAARAVALDDSSAEAYSALGWSRMNYRDWAGAEAALQRSIAIDPRATRAHEGLARVYLFTGRHAEQLAEAQRGVELDPYSHSAVRELALALMMNGRCDEAIERLRPLKTLTPPARVAGVIAGQCHAANGRWPEAIAEFRWAAETNDARTAPSFLGYALARGGHADEAQRILSDLLAGRRNSQGAFGIATVYAGLGNYDEAFRWLHKAADEQSIRVYLMGPMFEELRRDPRFADVRHQLGL